MRNALKRLRVRGGALALLLVTALTLGTLVAGAPVAPSSATAAPGTASLAGLVTGKGTSTADVPLAGITVTLSGTGGTFTTKTNVSGRYTFSSFPTGNYSVRLQQEDRAQQPRYQDESFSAAFDAAGSSELNFGMRRLTGFWGTVTSTAGGANLGAYANGTVAFLNASSGAVAGTADIDSNGRYVSPLLWEGSYKVRFDAHAGSHKTSYYPGVEAYSAAAPITLGVSETRQIDGEVRRLGAVTGSLTLRTGLSGAVAPAASTPVSLFLGTSLVATASTNAQGVYSLEGLEANTYTVQFGANAAQPPAQPFHTEFYADVYDKAGARTITVQAGQTVSGIGAELSNVRPFTAAPAPAVAGLAQLGQTLQFHLPAWTPTASAMELQWKRTGIDIPGATGATYILVDSDLGETITLTATGSKQHYIDTVATSAPTAKVTGLLTTTPTPSIAGTFETGKTLTAHAGAWGPDPVTLSYQWNRAGSAVEGATTSSYTLGEADAGTAISVTVTGAKPNYVAVEKTSAATAVIVGVFEAAPVPTLTGEARLGETVTAAAGEWLPTSTVLSYQWSRSGQRIDGATEPDYTIVEADLGGRLTVTVSGARNHYGSVSRTSLETGKVTGLLAETPQPTVSGVTEIGETLTANAGTWAPAPVELSYRWQRAGIDIGGATDSRYTLVPADLGKPITVTVTGSKTHYTSVKQTSRATGKITGVLTKTPHPTISGEARSGQTLAAVTGTWEPSPVRLSYQWNRSGVAINGATSAKYTLVDADIASRITVTVSGGKSGYVGVELSSAPTAAVIGVFAAPVPTVVGTVKMGQWLKASVGTWSPSASLGYQWKRSGATIAGATSSSYKLTSSDLGKSITVVVTGKKSSYVTVSKTSAATAAVTTAFVKAPTPTISGTALVGKTLTASAGTWSPSASLSYQWKLSGAAIAGATGRTYVLKPRDASGAVTVTVTAKRASYATTAKTSATTKAVVGLKYANCTALKKAYPNGVAKPGTRHDKVAGVAKPFKGSPLFSASVYALNSGSDRDKDGIACEG